MTGLGTMLAMYVLCYPLRYLAMLNALEPSSAVDVTGTQLIEKAATTPLVIFVEVLTLIPIFGFSTWTFIQKQRTSNTTTVFLLFLFGLFLFGPIRDISEYPTIAAIEIAAASLFTFLGCRLSLRRLRKASIAAVNTNLPRATGSPHP
ncbi:hypothetical protein [Massilia eburnea]|uniref:hypothetical protein n=1 Tax=Massilia eburnea TaxID=1776165 RepID=UPI003D6B49C7